MLFHTEKRLQHEFTPFSPSMRAENVDSVCYFSGEVWSGMEWYGEKDKLPLPPDLALRGLPEVSDTSPTQVANPNWR